MQSVEINGTVYHFSNEYQIQINIFSHFLFRDEENGNSFNSNKQTIMKPNNHLNIDISSVIGIQL